jgi:hypothetical protein
MNDPQPKFGRLQAIDPRDANHLLRSINPQAAAAAANVPYRYHYHHEILDQGSSSACTGAAARQWLNMGPIRNTSGPDFMTLYRENQKVDEWSGAEPDYYGSSVRASFKVLKSLGFVSRYAWAFDLETVVNHVLTVSPCVLGTDWYSDMLRTDKQGFIHVGGRTVGGHAYVLGGVNRLKKCPDGSIGAGRIINSWSRSWGQSGMAWISFKDLDALIKADGEAATAFEQKAPATRSVEPAVMTAQTYD